MLVRDATGSLRAVWFNQPFLNDVFHPHQRVILFGKLELTSHGLQLQNPQYEILQAGSGRRRRARTARRRDAAHRADRAGLREDRNADDRRCSARWCTRRWRSCPPTLPDPLPADVRARQQLIDRRTALHDVHFPPEGTAVEAAERLPLAGAAPADLRRVLPVSARAGAAASARRSGAQAAVGRRSPTTSARRRAGCCRSS